MQTKATIELIIDDNGAMKYAVNKSGNAKLDKLLEVAIGTINLYAKTGGNVQSLMGTLSGPAQKAMSGLLGNVFKFGGM